MPSTESTRLKVSAATRRPNARVLRGNDGKRHATKLKTGEHFYPEQQHGALGAGRSALDIVFVDEVGLPFDLRDLQERGAVSA